MAYTIAEWCMSTLNLSNYDEVNKIKVNKSISLPQDAANCSSLVQKTEKTNKTANPDSKKENIVVGIPSILDEEIRLLASQLNLSITDIVQYAFYLCDKEPNSLSCAYKITRWMKLSFGIWIFNKNGKTIAKDFCTKNNVILKSTTPECKAIEFFADNDFLLNSLFSGKRDDFKGKITEFQANQKKTMSNDFKRCPICKETKDINKFYQDKDETISGYCKECHRNKRRINHKDNKSKAQAK